jgi:hypothetical protein
MARGSTTTSAAGMDAEHDGSSAQNPKTSHNNNKRSLVSSFLSFSRRGKSSASAREEEERSHSHTTSKTSITNSTKNAAEAAAAAIIAAAAASNPKKEKKNRKFSAIPSWMTEDQGYKNDYDDENNLDDGASVASRSSTASRFSFMRKYSERKLVRQVSWSLQSVDAEEYSWADGTSTRMAASTAGAGDDLSLAGWSMASRSTVHTTRSNRSGNRRGTSSTAITNRLVAAIHRHEFQVGELIGEGTFSRVFVIEQVQLRSTPYDSSSHKKLSATQQYARVQFQNSTAYQEYAVKHLDKGLLVHPKKFYQAALALKREAVLMTQLHHPNLLQARAISVGGSEALKSGRYKDFFIVSDRLTEDLDVRIQSWRQQRRQRRKQKQVKGGNSNAEIEAVNAQLLIAKLRYAQQLACALTYLHDKRMIFRDIKPANIGFWNNPAQQQNQNNIFGHPNNLPHKSTDQSQQSQQQPRDILKLFDFGLCRTLPPRCFHRDHADLEEFHMSFAGTTRYMVCK